MTVEVTVPIKAMIPQTYMFKYLGSWLAYHNHLRHHQGLNWNSWYKFHLFIHSTKFIKQIFTECIWCFKYHFFEGGGVRLVIQRRDRGPDAGSCVGWARALALELYSPHSGTILSARDTASEQKKRKSLPSKSLQPKGSTAMPYCHILNASKSCATGTSTSSQDGLASYCTTVFKTGSTEPWCLKDEALTRSPSFCRTWAPGGERRRVRQSHWAEGQRRGSRETEDAWLCRTELGREGSADTCTGLSRSHRMNTWPNMWIWESRREGFPAHRALKAIQVETWDTSVCRDPTRLSPLLWS